MSGTCDGGYIIQAISDSWIDSCYYTGDKFSFSIAETLRRIFHYDTLCTVILQILIILPVLFKIYGFGVQQRLKAFYDKVRYNFIYNFLIIGFSASLSAIIHLWVNQQMACICWNGSGIRTISNAWRMPNLDILMTFIIANAIVSLRSGYVLARYATAILLVLTNAACGVLQGYSSIGQMVVTVSLGLWIAFFFKFIPPIVVPFAAAVVLCGDIYFFVYWMIKYNSIINTLRDSMFLSIRGPLVLIIAVYLYLRYAFTRSEFRWTRQDWSIGISLKEGSSGDVAVIPTMEMGRKAPDFGSTLRKDLIDSVAAFLIFLVGNFAIKQQGYVFFQ